MRRSIVFAVVVASLGGCHGREAPADAPRRSGTVPHSVPRTKMSGADAARIRDWTSGTGWSAGVVRREGREEGAVLLRSGGMLKIALPGPVTRAFWGSFECPNGPAMISHALVLSRGAISAGRPERIDLSPVAAEAVCTDHPSSATFEQAYARVASLPLRSREPRPVVRGR